jgi:hypothetical protein
MKDHTQFKLVKIILYQIVLNVLLFAAAVTFGLFYLSLLVTN